MHLRWTIRPLELGRTAVTLRAELGALVRLEVYDGGGFCSSNAVWRIEGRVVRIEEGGVG